MLSVAAALLVGAANRPVAVLPTREVTLPVRSVAADVRFSGGKDVLVAAGKDGVKRLRRGRNGTLQWSLDIGGQGDPKGFFFSRMLANDGAMTVVASPFDAIGWQLAGQRVSAFPFATTIDIEVLGDRVFILGANRDGKGRWAPEGAIAWTGTLSMALRDLRPLLSSAKSGTTPPALGVAYCGPLEMGVIRTISDNEVLVIPGVEPGAYVFDRNGRLLRTFDTRGLGFLDRCDIGREQAGLFARDMKARMRWRNRERVLDEIVVIHGRPALIVRHVVKGRTIWDLIVLDSSGKASSSIRLPITSPSPNAHIRADVLDDEAVFLVRTYGDRKDRSDEQPPRLVFATIGSGR